eukprot:4421070-Amphidinium_carterae.1
MFSAGLVVRVWTSAGVGRLSSVGGSAGRAEPCLAQLYPWLTAKRSNACVGSSSCDRFGVWLIKLSIIAC